MSSRTSLMGNVLRFAAAAAILTAGATDAAQSLRPPTEDLQPKPSVEGFICDVARLSYQKEGDAKPTCWGLVPSTNRLAFAWSDLPFGIVVPFDVRTPPGRDAKILMDVRYGIDTAPGATARKHWEDHADLVNQPTWGLTVLESEVSPDDTVRQLLPNTNACTYSGYDERLYLWRQSYQSNTLGQPLVGRFDNVYHETETPFITGGGADNALTHTTLSFTKGNQRGAFEFWFVTTASPLYAAAGYYERFNDRDTPLYALPETMRVRLTVRMLEAPLRPGFGVNSNQLAMALGMIPCPSNAVAQFDGWRRLPDVEIEFTVRRNGWLFDHAELAQPDFEVLKERHEKKQTSDYSYYKQDFARRVNGRQFTMSSNWESWARPLIRALDKPDRYGNEYQMLIANRAAYRGEFPERMPDTAVVEWPMEGEVGWVRQKPSEQQEQNIGWNMGIGYLSDTQHAPVLLTSLDETNRAEFVRIFGERSGSFYSGAPRREGAPGPGRRKQTTRFWVQPAQYALEYGAIGHRWWKKDRQHAWLALDCGQATESAAGDTCFLGAYVRRSEVEPNLLRTDVIVPTTTPVAQDKPDPFWKWYPGLSRLMSNQLAKVDVIYLDAGCEADPLQELLDSAHRLTLDIGDRSAEGSVFDSEGDRVTQSDAAYARKLALLRETSAEIRDRRDTLETLGQDARTELQVILDKIDEGFDKFGDRHPELLVWKKEYRRMYERAPLEIALEAKDPETLRLALAAAETEAHSVDTRLWEADLHKASGDHIAELYALRDAVAMDPEDPVAEMKLQKLECTFLVNAINKSQGAIKQARAAFYGYLMERGFGQEDMHVTGTTTVERVVSWTTESVKQYTEDAWARLTTGLFGSFSALYGKPAAEADLLATTERQMTTAFIGLNSILRLRNAGFTFDEIAEMTSTEVLNALPLRHTDGTPYSEHDAALHRVAIREALKLPDIQALVTNDRVGLELGVRQGYWNNQDVGDTWIEWMGDATSVLNLIMLLPGARVGMGGRTGLMWTKADIEMMRDLEKMNKVISGTEAVANTIGLTRVLNAIGTTASAKRYLSYLARFEKYKAGLPWYRQAVWTSGKVSGMLALNAIVVTGTEEIAGHKAAMLVQAALMFVGDTETLIKLLKRRNIPPEKVAALVINEYLPATEVHLKRLAQIDRTSLEMKDLFERVKRGRPLSADDFVFLDKYFEKSWRKLVPNGKASHDASIALGASAEGARAGVDNGAGAAVNELAPDLKAESEATRKSQQDAKQLAKELEAASDRGPPAFEGQTLGDLKAYESDGEFTYPVPPRPAPGSISAQAEAALLADDPKKAKALYRKAREELSAGYAAQTDEFPPDLLELKIALDEELEATPIPNGILKAESLKYAEPIAETEAAAILDHPELWEDMDTTGRSGFMHTVKGHPEFLVKVITTDLAQNLEGEMVGQALARRLGFNVPGVSARAVYSAYGTKIEKVIFVMRKINGKPMSQLTAAEIFRYRDQLSRARALSLVLGDFDRKLDNFIVTEDGRLYLIDWGWADPSGIHSPFVNSPVPVDAPARMEGAFGLDHWLSRSYKDDVAAILGESSVDKVPRLNYTSSDPQAIVHRKCMLSEQSLTYQAAKPTIEQIETLIGDDEALSRILNDAYSQAYRTEAEFNAEFGRRVRAKARTGDPLTEDQIKEQVRALIDGKIADCVTAAMDNIKKRGAKLDDVMKGLNKRNGLPLPNPSGAAGHATAAVEPRGKSICLHIANAGSFEVAA